MKPTCARCRLFIVDRDGDLCECCRWRASNVDAIKRRTQAARVVRPRAERAPSFRFGSLRLTNTEQDVLSLVRYRPGVSVESIVAAWYPKTRQPDKKCRTFEGVLRRLQRMCLIRRVGDGWYPADAATVTPTGGAA